ncbi:RelA/SpoT family protein, partial [Neisseria sp. P0003.S003]
VVEHKPYPLSQALESGQTVEIVTSENTHPSVSWLNFVVTARARTRIRHFLKLLRADDAVQTGKKQLEMALKPHYLSEISEEKIQAVLN